MLFISKQDMNTAVSPQEMLDRIEKTLLFYETGDFYMPVRSHLDYGDDTLLLMPCFTKEVFGAKLVSLFPKNADKNLPVINAVMILNDAETGQTLAMLDGSALTAMRTGAVGGVGVRHLAPGEPHGLGLVGAGVQARQQAKFACAAAAITHINVYDRLTDKIPAFAEQLQKDLPDVPVKQVKSPEELLANSRTIITATTSNEPVLPDVEELLAGRRFIGIGSYKPTMREYPESVFRLLDNVFVDTEHALVESGDLIDPLEKGWIDRDRVKTLGSFISENGRIEEGQSALFKSVGMALFDVQAAHLIYTKARALNLGVSVDL